MRPEHERTKRHACTDKLRYADPAVASETIRRLRRAQVKAREPQDWNLRVYRCAFSGSDVHFHVGHPPSVIGLERLARAMRDLPPPRPAPEYA